MRLRGRPTWWAAVALLFAAGFGTNVSTPLLPIYRERLDLSPSVVTAIFGVYALGLAPSLLFGGPASDRFGRTTVLLPATVLAGAASLVFLGGENSVGVLFVARFVQGLASGAAFSVGSAWLQDLVGPDHATSAARRASLALSAGFCAGPLMSGLLGEYGPRPLVLPYLVHVAVVALLLVAAIVITRDGAWSAGRRGTAGATVLPRPHLGPGGRRVFGGTLVPIAICVYAFPSVAVTVLPIAHRGIGHVVAFTGALSAIALGAGAAVQPIAHRLGSHLAPVAASLGVAGYAMGAVAVRTDALAVSLIAGALLGAGGGLALNAGLLLVQRLSTNATRGATNGLFYTWAYLGFAAPLIVTSVVTVQNLAIPMVILALLAAATASWLLVSPKPG